MIPRKFIQSSFPTVPRCRTYFSANKIGGCTNPYTSDHNVDNLAKNTQSENKYIEIVIMVFWWSCVVPVLILSKLNFVLMVVSQEWSLPEKFWKSIILLFPSVLQQTSINSTMAVYPARANLTNHVLIRLTFRSNKCLRLKYPESSHNPPTHPPPQPLCAPTFFASHSVQLVNYTEAVSGSFP